MFYIRPRKNESIKGFYICYKDSWGITSHYVENESDIDYFLNLLEDNGMTPEQMNKVRVYPALSWRIHNVFFDEYGGLKFWAKLAGIFLVATIIITVVLSS